MTRRGWFLAGVAGLMLLGCARPGATGDGSTEQVSPAPTGALPTAGLAACFDIHATPSATPSDTAAPLPSGDGPGDQFERNRRANNAFRDRTTLPAFAYAGAEPCVEKVRAHRRPPAESLSDRM